MDADAIIRRGRPRPAPTSHFSTVTLLVIGLAVGGLFAQYIDHATRPTAAMRGRL